MLKPAACRHAPLALSGSVPQQVSSVTQLGAVGVPAPPAPALAELDPAEFPVPPLVLSLPALELSLPPLLLTVPPLELSVPPLVLVVPAVPLLLEPPEELESSHALAHLLSMQVPMLEAACVHADDEALLLVQPAEQSAEYSELHELSTQDLQAAEALPKSEVGTQLLPLSLFEPQAGSAARPSKANTTMRGLFMISFASFAWDKVGKFP